MTRYARSDLFPCFVLLDVHFLIHSNFSFMFKCLGMPDGVLCEDILNLIEINFIRLVTSPEPLTPYMVLAF